MRRLLVQVSFSVLLAFLFTLVTGCGSVSGSSNAPSPTPTPISNPSPTPTPVASPTPSPTPMPVASAQIVYEASFICTLGNQSCADGKSTDGIYAYRVNTANGEVSDVPGSPFFTSSNALFVTALPSGKFVYAVDNVIEVGGRPPVSLGANDIVTFKPDSVTGALTKVATTPLASFPLDVVMHPSGKFLYAFVQDLVGFTVNQNTGALTPIAIPAGLTSNLGTQSMVVDPTGKFLYAATSDRIFAFRINATTGELTPIGSPITFANFPFLRNLSIHPSGKFLYVSSTETNGFQIFGMSIDPTTGALTQLPDSPYAHGNRSIAVLDFVKDGTFANASELGNNEMTVLAVNTSTGTLTVEGSVATPQSTAEAIVTDQSEQFIYLGGEGIMGFRIQGDGTPLLLPGFPHGAGISSGQHSLAIAPLP